MDLHRLRVDAAHHVLERAALAGGVDSLQHEEHAEGVLGGEPVLVLAQEFYAVGEQACRPRTGHLAGVSRIVVPAQLDSAPRGYPQRFDEIGHVANALVHLSSLTRAGHSRVTARRVPARCARKLGESANRRRGSMGPVMWNSFRTDARDGLTAEVITYPAGGGDEIHAYVARPTGDEPRPGIVAVHHLPGWDEFYREFSDRLARHGYTVICPDLYCRFGHGTPDDVAARVRTQGGVHDDSVVADCAAALAWLKALPTSNGRVGIIGSCSGGRHALLAASRLTGFDAVADLWGGGVIAAREELTPARPVAPIDYTA